MNQDKVTQADVTRWDPAQGQAFQGDVVLLSLPADIEVARTDEVARRADGTLVLAEGEATGHHHAMKYGLEGVARFHDGGLARSLPPDSVRVPAIGKAVRQAPRVALYRDPDALGRLIQRGILTTPDLCIGFLVVEDEAPPVTHDEHGAIAVPAGSYYVGRKREMQAADVRPVLD